MKTCHHCSAGFEVTEADRAFYDKVSPVFNGVKYAIPEPSLCPECRQQRRYSFRNEKKLYRGKCDLTGDSVVTFYSPRSERKILGITKWWSDEWDALSEDQNFDFGKSFFEQFAELEKKVPKMSMMVTHCENCEYSPYAVYSRNCYFGISCVESEDVHYSLQANKSRDCLDCSFCTGLELSYQCLHSVNLFDSRNCQDCENGSGLEFCVDCRGCHDCLGCKNLVNKKKYIFNRPVSDEEFARVKNILKTTSGRGSFSQKVQEFFSTLPYRAHHNINCENCTGDHLQNCKNSKNCFDATDLEDCAFAYPLPMGAKDCQDIHYSLKSELVWNSMSAVNNYHTAFMLHSWDMKDSYYCDECFFSNNLFGCVGLKRKQYCILNRQYTKEQYEELVPKIIEHMKQTGEWGEFFPPALSPFGYNETVAQEYFPMTREVVEKWNAKIDKSVGAYNHTPVQYEKFNWSDYESPTPTVEKVITTEMMKNLPDDISKIPNDVLNWALTCEESGKLFIIQKPELEFYRKMNLSIPHRHPDIRHADRMKLRNPRKLWKRNCGNCGTAIETTYSPDRPEKVLCEKCYLDVVS